MLGLEVNRMKQWKSPSYEEVSLCCEINSYSQAEIA
jgi:coenzyme PQQ precursor peptide PqqA